MNHAATASTSGCSLMLPSYQRGVPQTAAMLTRAATSRLNGAPPVGDPRGAYGNRAHSNGGVLDGWTGWKESGCGWDR